MFLHTRIVTFVSAFVIFWAVYRVHDVSSRDPTSVFFRPKYGYAPRYSTIRRLEAEDFVARANVSERDGGGAQLRVQDGGEERHGQEAKRKLCVGIPSVASRDVAYLRGTVGSLLEGLTASERDEIYFVVFIPHAIPSTHPAYTAPWLTALADEVLTYDPTAPEFAHMAALEAEGGEFREKGLYDYRHLLKHCARQRTQHIAIFEDDILAVAGWYPLALAALATASDKSIEDHASSEFLYLRLFYTEEFLGWNSEDWTFYLGRSLVVFVVPMACLYALRTRSTLSASRFVTPSFLTAAALIITLTIGAFFALGRVTVAPLPPGVSLMPKYGCCSQALVFPRGRALEIASYFAERRAGSVDVVIEDFANERHELRWAVSPALVQHVGRESSKGDDFGDASKYGMSVAEKIWSFGFEGWGF